MATGLSVDDPRVVTATLERVTGIDFGCDLTLSWPYVLTLTPDGSAQRSGVVFIGDQLVAVAGRSVIGLQLGDVMDIVAQVQGSEIALTFFRGDRAELQRIVAAGLDAPATVTVTIQRPGKHDLLFTVPYGANLRDE